MDFRQSRNTNGRNINGRNINDRNTNDRNTNGSYAMGSYAMGSYAMGSYAHITGTIVELEPVRTARRTDGCTIFATIEDENGNTVNFIITSSAYIVDNITLSVGMLCTFWYRTDVPVPLIYPPQYRAVVGAQKKNDRMIDVSYYNNMLVNEEQTLKLNLDRSVELRTANNQYYQADPADNDLVVIYTVSTRSIPAQTTPERIVVLCREEM